MGVVVLSQAETQSAEGNTSCGLFLRVYTEIQHHVQWLPESYHHHPPYSTGTGGGCPRRLLLTDAEKLIEGLINPATLIGLPHTIDTDGPDVAVAGPVQEHVQDSNTPSELDIPPELSSQQDEREIILPVEFIDGDQCEVQRLNEEPIAAPTTSTPVSNTRRGAVGRNRADRSAGPPPSLQMQSSCRFYRMQQQHRKMLQRQLNGIRQQQIATNLQLTQLNEHFGTLNSLIGLFLADQASRSGQQ
ncbi:uncharacterized protein LOC143806490 isoform X2 [Ranitomeya variabilis]|uniref:uncharacterized protein LOC143806490 isoform X2 n=1 Tax=Ranitomeya variabilis TaxID=490064 RepID=UPI0040561441